MSHPMGDGDIIVATFILYKVALLYKEALCNMHRNETILLPTVISHYNYGDTSHFHLIGLNKSALPCPCVLQVLMISVRNLFSIA